MLLVPLALYVLVRTGIRIERRFVPLLVALIVLSLYALSNKITAGSVTLVNLPLPEAMGKVANIFRASSRMIWPVYCVACLAAFCLVAKRVRFAHALPVVLLALILQGVETHRAGRSIRSRYFEKVAAQWRQPLTVDFWDIAAVRYRLSFIRAEPVASGGPGGRQRPSAPPGRRAWCLPSKAAHPR